LLGRALEGRRDRVVLASKVGRMFDYDTRYMLHDCIESQYIGWSLDQTLKNLNTDYLDVYLLHAAECTDEQAVEVRDLFEELVSQGKIRWYGWVVNDAAKISVFAEGEHCAVLEFPCNLLRPNEPMLAACESQKLAGLCCTPLELGLLAGKYDSETTFPFDDKRTDWNFKDGPEKECLRRVESVREIMTAGGRTMSQAAIGWLWAKREAAIPIPGFKTVAQAEENAKALELGPLGEDQMKQIDDVLSQPIS